MASTLQRSLAQRRWLPVTSRPWRALGYLLVVIPLPVAVGAAVTVSAATGPLVAVAVGVPLLLAYALLAAAAGPLQRRAPTLLGQRPVPDPHRPVAAAEATALVRHRLGEAATWREVIHALVNIPAASIAGLVLLVWATSPLLLAAPLLIRSGALALGPFTLTATSSAWAAAAGGVAVLIAGTYAVTAVAAAHAALTRGLLGPRGEELRRQVTELTRSRLRLIDAFDVERQRIERDLHDGAQQHLAALAMTLDLARIELEGTPQHRAAALLDRAHAQATGSLAELRELIQGIHPPMLTELGLPGAVQALADRSAIPVEVTVDLPGRPAPAVESAAYFVLAEALANAAKHSGARRVHVDVHGTEDSLVLQVVDDGAGGADPDRGTGLTGLGDRVSVVGGRLTFSSPPGGPTSIRAHLPHRPGGDLP